MQLQVFSSAEMTWLKFKNQKKELLFSKWKYQMHSQIIYFG